MRTDNIWHINVFEEYEDKAKLVAENYPGDPNQECAISENAKGHLKYRKRLPHDSKYADFIRIGISSQNHVTLYVKSESPLKYYYYFIEKAFKVKALRRDPVTGKTKEVGIKWETFISQLRDSLLTKGFTPISADYEKKYAKETFEHIERILTIPFDAENCRLEVMPLEQGYNLKDLPYSCMKNYGHRFRMIDEAGLAEMYVMYHGNKPQARAIVWKPNVVHSYVHDTSPIPYPVVDRNYYVDGQAADIFYQLLSEKFPEAIYAWEKGECEMNPYLDDSYIQISREHFRKYDEYPWMDTFSVINWDYDQNIIRLNAYDWKYNGYDSEALSEFDEGILLSTAGCILYPGNEIWSENLGRDIDPDSGDIIYCDYLDDYCWIDSSAIDYFTDGIVDIDHIDAIYLEDVRSWAWKYHGNGTPREDIVCTKDDCWYLKENCWCDGFGDWHYERDEKPISPEDDPDEYYTEDALFWCKADGTWWLIISEMREHENELNKGNDDDEQDIDRASDDESVTTFRGAGQAKS